MATTAGSIVIDLLMKTGSFETDSKRAEQRALQMGKTFERAGKLIGGAMVAVTGVAVLAARSAIDYADSLDKMSQRTSLSVETLNGLSYAADLSDTSLEALGLSVGRLAKYIGEANAGNREAQDTLKRLGISAKDPEEALYQLADAFKSMEDPNQRATELNKILSRSWQELAPLLSGGSAALRTMVERGKELNPVTAEMARQSAELNDNLTTLTFAAKGLGAALAKETVGPLSDITRAMTEAVKEGSVLKAIWVGLGGLGAALYTGEFASPQTKIAKLNQEIADLEQRRKGLERNASGIGIVDRWFWGDKDDLDAKIAHAKTLIAGLEAQINGIKSPATKNTTTLPSVHPAAAAAADPLASVLSQTYLARVQEYVKLVGLLNARFADGARNPEQYAQALEALYQKAFGPELAEAARRQQNELDNTAFEVDSYRDAINQARQDQADYAQAIQDTNQALIDSVEPTAALLRELSRLEGLRDLPGINQAAVTAAIFNTQDQLDKALVTIQDKTTSVAGFTEEAWKSAAQNIQSSLADFLFDPFQDGLDGMLLGFVNMLRRMASEALAANILSSIFGWSASQGGVVGSIAGAMVSGIPARANGGSVSAGSLYRINERGTEYFRPNTDGMVYPVAPSISQQLSSRQESQTIRAVLVDDQRRVGDYLATPAGEQAVWGIIQRSPSRLRAIGGG